MTSVGWRDTVRLSRLSRLRKMDGIVMNENLALMTLALSAPTDGRPKK